MELEDATVLFFSEIVEVVRVASESICALSPRSTVDKQVIDVLMGWTRCPKGFMNTSSASQLQEVLEQVIEVLSAYQAQVQSRIFGYLHPLHVLVLVSVAGAVESQ